MSLSRPGRLLAGALVAAALAVPAAAAADPFGAHDLSVTTSTTQAGAHPDVVTAFALNTTTDPAAGEVPAEALKTVRLSLPAGLVGDAAHLPQCPAATFAQIGGSCPPESQVGVAHLDTDIFNTGPASFPIDAPVYNIAPGAGRPAVFGFQAIVSNVALGFGVRTSSDAGLDARIDGITEAGRVYAQSLTLWGVPADHVGGGRARVPLLRNPTSCGPLSATLGLTSWEHPDREVTATTDLPATTGCDAVPFDPSLTVTPEATSADAPTGLDVAVSLPQRREADALGTADVRRAVVTLPAGYTISPSAADGLQLCPPAAAALASDAPGTCPDASRIGSAQIDSPLLAGPLTGTIALGPNTAPGRFALYVEAAGDGVRIKLPGTIQAEADTGRLTATFDETPQQPFSRLALHFDGGPRAVLATPATCGTTDAQATFTPWSATAPVDRVAPVALGGGACPDGVPFAPTLTAGVSDPHAAADTAFSFTVAREDRTQPIARVTSVALPQGLTARVGTVPLCAAGPAAAGTCPESSRVGTVAVAAGPGAHPVRLTGAAYLTAGYAGAPFGLSLVVRAIAGPLDLGTVVVRSAVRVGLDSRITVDTDPLPAVLAGIPLRLREVGLTLDRPGFVRNPTGCAPGPISASLTGVDGAQATRSAPFGLTGCRALAFDPIMKGSLTPSTRKAGSGLHVTITARDRQANLQTVAVALPPAVTIRLKSLGTVCRPGQLAADRCPAASQVGGASARTPILAEPLKGPVYLVQASKRLPHLVAVLHGSGVAIQLNGATGVTKGGRVTTTFAGIPDVPISRFDLDLPRGRRAFLETTKLPCTGAALGVTFTAHNGARRTRTVPLSGTCPKARR